MKEIINKLMSNENVRNGIQIALTIGLIGTMLGLMEYDLRVNGEHYAEQRQKRQELCLADPKDCPSDTFFSPFIW